MEDDGDDDGGMDGTDESKGTEELRSSAKTPGEPHRRRIIYLREEAGLGHVAINCRRRWMS